MKLSLTAKERLERVTIHKWGHLNMRNCGLTEIPDELFYCPWVISLDFGNDLYVDDREKNRIDKIPEKIENLIELNKIILSNNKIKYVTEKLTKLPNLRVLFLDGNKLTNFPSSIANMASLKELHIENNPFEMLPPEITARGIESIKNFFKELDEKDYLYEAKLIIVGEGRVGKTCLSKALINQNYTLSNEESTEGININPWVLNVNEINKINKKIHRDLQINIWDFGGQEIYHSTHQFFLTKRAVYLLVTESRKEDRHEDFYYWLNIIKILGDNSPVILVLNKCDQPTKDLPIKEYKETFNNIFDFHQVSLAQGFEVSIQKLRETILTIASNLPHIGTPLPKLWVDIRLEIEKLKMQGKNYISEKEYFDICKKHYRDTESALFLSEFFHDLGVILHFKDDFELKDTIILNSEWVTKGVYKILDDRQVIENKGRFNNTDLIRIWSEEDFKEKIRELLFLMKNKKFDLCFELTSGEYLVPRLLPVDEIEFDWDATRIKHRFEIKYKFMPKGIVARLIVKLSEDISNNTYWRYGVLLEYNETIALIRERYFESKITIELAGINIRDYLSIIRKELSEIHKDYRKLEFEEMIPCLCDICSTTTNPFFYPFITLRKYELRGLKFIRCNNSLEEVLIKKLLEDVEVTSQEDDKVIFCENTSAQLLEGVGYSNCMFYPARDNRAVFVTVRTQPQYFGLRDRDFLIDNEIERLKVRYKNYYILEFYAIENYLYHPENLAELRIQNLNINYYTSELIKQKNHNKNLIISRFKEARRSYEEFQIERDKVMQKDADQIIIEYLESDEIDIFLKAFSIKQYFNKEFIAKYGLTEKELAKTNWFKKKLSTILATTLEVNKTYPN